MSEVTCRPLADNEDVIVAHLVKTVLTLWEDKAVSLAVHGLRTQSAGNQEDVAVSELGNALGHLKQSDLDSCVLLRSDAFATATIVVGTGLSLGLRKDSVALSELNFVVGLEVVELPADKHVIVRVLVRRGEAASPVCVDAELVQVLFAKGREEVEPVVGIAEFRDIFFRDSELLQDFVLS